MPSASIGAQAIGAKQAAAIRCQPIQEEIIVDYRKTLSAAAALTVAAGAAGLAVSPASAGTTTTLPNGTSASCLMSFSQSSYYYKSGLSATVTTFAWGTNGTLKITCIGEINGASIDAGEPSLFEEHGMETATCAQGAGYADVTLTLPTTARGKKTIAMRVGNTFTGTTYNLAGANASNRLVGSWALPPSSAPCPATDPGPVNDIQVAHTFQIDSARWPATSSNLALPPTQWD